MIFAGGLEKLAKGFVFFLILRCNIYMGKVLIRNGIGKKL